jgi:hypothetical protein
MLGLRLQLQARNLQTYLGTSLGPGLTVPSPCRNWTIVWAVWSRPRLRYRLASLRANRRLKKR